MSSRSVTVAFVKIRLTVWIHLALATICLTISAACDLSPAVSLCLTEQITLVVAANSSNRSVLLHCITTGLLRCSLCTMREPQTRTLSARLQLTVVTLSPLASSSISAHTHVPSCQLTQRNRCRASKRLLCCPEMSFNDTSAGKCRSWFT